MFQNNDLSINELIKLTAKGIVIADFTQIRAALINRYKVVYGSDIDLSTGTADGVFINDLALIINNILQCMNIMYQNLDVSSASGVYLDILCSLSNVTRRPATASNTYVNMLYISPSNNTLPQLFSADELTLIDKAGNEWKPTEDQEFISGQTKAVYVTCQTVGPIKAPKNWIYQFVNASLSIDVSQEYDANVGTEEESDASLRARRAQSTGAAGTTTMEALVGELLQISAIKNAYVYENNTGSSVTVSDGTDVDAHSIYVTIAFNDGMSVADSDIGTIIYKKLTPGIHSCQTDDSTNGISKSFNYVAVVNGLTQDIATQTAYWKQALPICPDITIKILPNDYFSSEEFPLIANGIIKYCNNLSINVALTANDLLLQAMHSDPSFRGLPTYSVTSATASSYTNAFTYYKYDYYFISCDGTVSYTGGEDITITDGQFTLDDKTFTVYNDRVATSTDTYMLTNSAFIYDNVTYTVNVASYNKDLNDNYVLIIKG